MAQRPLPTSLQLFVAILFCGIGWTANGQSLNTIVSARGQIEAGSDLFSLGTSATGTISQLLVKPGDHVQAGQPLLRVDCRALEGGGGGTTI
jgi:multidrug efflux pump subunit AcrA (membrane-fusion protein)